MGLCKILYVININIVNMTICYFEDKKKSHFQTSFLNTVTQSWFSFQIKVLCYSLYVISVMNLTDVLTNTPIVEVFAVGGFLYRPPSRQTQNVTIMIENPVTGTVKVCFFIKSLNLYIDHF